MFFRHALSLAALSVLYVCPLAANGIDPFSIDNYPDPDLGVAYEASGPICFPEGLNSICLDNVTLGGATTDSYTGPSGEELDSFSGLMSAQVFENGSYEGDWLVPYDASTVDDRTSGTEYGAETLDEATWLTDGPGNVLPQMELRMDPDQPNPGGSATINPTTGGYSITSFFDIFVDLSIDGGNTWTPSASAPEAQFNLISTSTPEPRSSTLALAGLISLAAFLRRKRPFAAKSAGENAYST